MPDSLLPSLASLSVSAAAARNLVASLVLFVLRGGTDGGVPKDELSNSPRVRFLPTRDVVRSVGMGTGTAGAILLRCWVSRGVGDMRSVGKRRVT